MGLCAGMNAESERSFTWAKTFSGDQPCPCVKNRNIQRSLLHHQERHVVGDQGQHEDGDLIVKDTEIRADIKAEIRPNGDEDKGRRRD
jgi:hypothetical protein